MIHGRPLPEIKDRRRRRLGIGVGDVVVGLRRRGRRGRPRLSGVAHVDDARARETLEHLAHQRMRLSAARALGLARVRRLAQRRRGRAWRQRHHPALAGPFLQASRQCLREAGEAPSTSEKAMLPCSKRSSRTSLLQRLDELNVALRRERARPRPRSARDGRRLRLRRLRQDGAERGGALRRDRRSTTLSAARGPPPAGGSGAWRGAALGRLGELAQAPPPASAGRTA